MTARTTAPEAESAFDEEFRSSGARFATREERPGPDLPQRLTSGRLHLTRTSPRPAPAGIPVYAGRARARMGASVSTISSSVRERRCSTRNDRLPTFHSAWPLDDCGSSFASVSDGPSSSGVVHVRRRLAIDDPGLAVGQKSFARRTWWEPAARAEVRSESRCSPAHSSPPTPVTT